MIRVSLILVVFTSPLLSAEEWSWRESPRDVYQNGEPSPEARYYYSSKYKGGVLILPDLPQPILIKKQDDITYLFRGEPKQFTTIEDGLKLTTQEEPSTHPIGQARVIDGKHLLFGAFGSQFLIARHAGLRGVVTPAELHETLPSWKIRRDQYQPDEGHLTVLKSLQVPTKVTVYFGSWCGDSRRETPRLIKLLEQVANPQIQLELIAIPGDFSSPQPQLRDDRVTNVPTIIVSREDDELGRITESPQGKSLEEDLAGIVGFTYLEQIGVLTKAKQLSGGVYQHRDTEGSPTSVEIWKTWARDRGGEALFSMLKDEDGDLKTWLMTNKEGAPVWLQITHTHHGHISRARYRIKKDSISGTIRGSHTGIVKQTLYYDQPLLLQTPSTLINGRIAARVHKQAQRLVLNTGSAYLEPVAAPTQLSRITHTPQGRFRCLETTFADQTWLVDLDTDLPISLTEPNGSVDLIQIDKTIVAEQSAM